MTPTRAPLPDSPPWPAAQMEAINDLVLEILARHHRTVLDEVRATVAAWRLPDKPQADPRSALPRSALPRSARSQRMASLTEFRAQLAGGAAPPGRISRGWRTLRAVSRG